MDGRTRPAELDISTPATAYFPEDWRPVVGHEARYSVSNLGRVRGPRGHILKARYNPKRRYCAIHLDQGGGKYVDRYLHVLVAEAFLGPKPTGLDVNHKDGNRQNNAASNLEYITRSENHRHAAALGLRGRRRGQLKLAL